jgi:hypothetical protein
LINYANAKAAETFVKERVHQNSELKKEAADLIKMYEHEKQGLIKILKQSAYQKIDA